MSRKCLLCSSRDTQRVITGNHLCDGCFPKWLAMRKRSFKNLIASKGCTAHVNDAGEIVHDQPCSEHNRSAA